MELHMLAKGESEETKAARGLELAVSKAKQSVTTTGREGATEVKASTKANEWASARGAEVTLEGRRRATAATRLPSASTATAAAEATAAGVLA